MAEFMDAHGGSAGQLLAVDSVTVEYTSGSRSFLSRFSRSDATVALDDVSVEISVGECLGIAGESGSGKSTLGRVICGLERPKSGRVLFSDKDLTKLGEKEMREFRSKIQIVFQDSMSSFNPKMTVGQSVSEPLKMLRSLTKAEIRKRVAQGFEEVGLDRSLIGRYPHELSGGQRQRAGIARALSVDPHIVVFDEPVSALDFINSERILQLIDSLTKERSMSSVLVSHDLSAVARCAHRTAIMKDGAVVELGATSQVLSAPKSDYTLDLLRSVPLGLTNLESKPELG